MSTSLKAKGKERALPNPSERRSISPSEASGSSESESDSEEDSSTSDDESGSDEEITQEYLESLLDKARKNLASVQPIISSPESTSDDEEEDIIHLDDGQSKLTEPALPPLDPGSLPVPYIELGDLKQAGPSKARDLDAETAAKASSSKLIPDAPPPPPELTKSGNPLTKKERKALKNATAGPGWFDLPAPAEADLPRLYREVEALRLRNQLDPKRFYRKDEGEGKGTKGLPKHFAIGTIITESTPFGAGSSDNLSRAQRKRTLVDELVDDSEAKSYAKKKFKELQSIRMAKGRGTLAKKKASRKPKW